MIQLTDKIISIHVPDDAEDLEASIQDDGIPCLTYYSGRNTEPTVVCLPPGNWRFLFATKQATEEQAKQVVETLHTFDPDDADLVGDGYEGDECYPDYIRGNDGYTFLRALDSLNSLLKAKGCNINNNHALIEKI